MIIKSNERAYEIVKTTFAVMAGTMVLCLIASWIAWHENSISKIDIFISDICIFILLFLTGVYYWVRDCKKIILSDKGCAIILGPFKRSFCWDEIQTKKAENYGAVEAFVKNYGKGVYFAQKSLDRMFFKRAMVLRPLSSFRVFFSETKVRDYWWNDFERHDKPDCYSAEEKAFFEQMESWRVVIEPADKEFIGLEKIRRQMNVRPASLKSYEEDSTNE